MGVISCGTTMIDQGQFQNLDILSWDTTAKTANFTAVAGNGYFVNTTSGAITVTLPASPSAGDQVGLKDYAQTWAANNVTVARNGSNVEGVATNATLDDKAQSITFFYVDATRGWVTINEALSKYGALFVSATGGCVVTCGNYKIHTFTSPGSFVVSCAGNSDGSNTLDYMVQAGGGGGGIHRGGGGGGAGGFRESVPSPAAWTASPRAASGGGLTASATSYPITVGAGGASASCGSDSIFSTITSTGGGQGADNNEPVPKAGSPGGSGGGGSGQPSGPGGSGNTPPVSPSQGSNGGAGSPPTGWTGSGGGGGGGVLNAGTAASSAGGCYPAPASVGGDGAGTAIAPATYGTPGPNGSLRYYGGGGGGSTSNCNPGTPAPATIRGPSVGGGGIGGKSNVVPTSDRAGGTNTGGGGGGAASGCTATDPGGVGGSGIVHIRYKFQ